MTFCYCCTGQAYATRAIRLKQGWVAVCDFHATEVIEEETSGIMVRTIENHEEIMRSEREVA